MLFLANENIPWKTCEDLKNEGINIISVKEIAPGAQDESVLKIANKDKRILITFDKDFGKLIYMQKMITTGVILLRFPPKSASIISKNIKKILSMENIILEEHFTVVKSDKIRSRPLSLFEDK